MARRTVCQTPRRPGPGQTAAVTAPATTTSPVPPRIPASQAGFLTDLGRVLKAWRSAPLLPLLILAIGVLQLVRSSGEGIGLLAGVVAFLLLGSTGAERLWYLRLWTGRTLTLQDAWRANLRCLGRFLVLALLVFGIALVVGLPAIVGVVRAADVAGDGTVTFPDGLPTWTLVWFGLMVLVGYALLTFVTPALVYSSKRVRDAIPIGLRLLRVSWPHTAAYVLVPAVATALPTLLLGDDPFGRPSLLASATGILVLALCRGAVASYYVRTVPGAGPDGAVRLGTEPGYYPAPAPRGEPAHSRGAEGLGRGRMRR